MGAENALERLTFCLAELRELTGHMSNGTVVLAQLDDRAARGRHSRGRKTISRQRFREHRRLGINIAAVASGNARRVAKLEIGKPPPCEIEYRVGTAHLSHVAKCGHRELISHSIEHLASRCGQAVEPRGPATTTLGHGSKWRFLACLNQTSVNQTVEVPADDRARKIEPFSEIGRRCRATIEEGACNAARASDVFHTLIVV